MPLHSPHRFGPAEFSACVQLARAAMAEDLGQTGDITSRVLVPAEQQGAAKLVARVSGVLAGLDAARVVFAEVDPSITWEGRSCDGASIEPATPLAAVSGSLRSLLGGERVALNFLQRLSGVATLTRRFVDAIAGCRCAIYDTRKTTPGWRVLEKYAVRVGGGRNHRMGLHDAVLIKDNHLVAWRRRSGASNLADAVRLARASVAPGTVVEIEVDSIDQMEQAIQAEPDIVLLDNMSLEQLGQAVVLRDRRAPTLILEASGGVSLEGVRQIAETGIDRISVGTLTHSAPALDIALDFEELAG